MKILTRMFIRTNKQAWLLIVVTRINSIYLSVGIKQACITLQYIWQKKMKVYINSTNPKVSTIQYSSQQAFQELESIYLDLFSTDQQIFVSIQDTYARCKNTTPEKISTDISNLDCTLMNAKQTVHSLLTLQNMRGKGLIDCFKVD